MSWEVSEGQRFAIYHALLAQWNGEGFPYGAVNAIAKKFGVSRWTVRRYWKMGQDAKSPEDVAEAIKSQKKGRVGRKRIPLAVLHKALKVARRQLHHPTEVHGGFVK